MDPAPTPLISVIIPIWNRPAEIEQCLRSIAALRYPRDRVEVIVVDDASTDETPQTVLRQKEIVPSLQLLETETNSGPSDCRNRGVRIARGEYVAFIDGDCLADPDWLTDLMQEFADADVVAVGGAIVPMDTKSWIQRYEAVSHPSYRGRRRRTLRRGSAYSYLAGCNMVVRRADFLAVGGFDVSLRQGEDVEIVWKLTARRGEVRYRPDGRVSHPHLDRLAPWLRGRATYAGAEATLMRLHPESRRGLAFPLPPLIALAWMIGALIAGCPLLVAAGISPLLADGAALLIESRRRGMPLGALAASRRLAASYLSIGYGVVTIALRCYALPLVTIGLLLGLRWPAGFLGPIGVAAGLLGTAVVEWARRRPSLGIAAFTVVYILDIVACHVGILRGCMRERTIAPLVVRVSVPLTSAGLVLAAIDSPDPSAPAASGTSRPAAR